MKNAYTLLDSDMDDNSGGTKSTNTSTNNIQTTSAEGALLFMVALVGGLGNISLMIVTIICPTLRQMSTAFLFHHCLLDAAKSGFCIPFGYSLLQNTDIAHCDVIGASYIFLMTISAYNLLALLVNEEYQCSLYTQENHRKTSHDCCCTSFGIIIIWFTTVLLHLGVIFLPGSSEFSKSIGNCVYRHGVTKNYVIHALWIILVTGAITVASVSFFKFFRKLQFSVENRKWAFLHKSLSSLHHNNVTDDVNEEGVYYEFDDITSQKIIILSRQYMQRIIIMMSMVTSFVICWYPLFLLTLVDIHYVQPAYIYRRLMILAWAHPVTTPIFCSIIFYSTSNGEKVAKDVYSNAIPMTSSRSGEAIRHEINHTDLTSVGGTMFHNQNFQFTCNSANISPLHCHQESEWENPQLSNLPPPPPPQTTTTTASNFDTIINYNVDECRYHTLIM